MDNMWYDEPFGFAYGLMTMDLDILLEIFPETGTVENIFRFYTYEEAKKQYLEWYNK